MLPSAARENLETVLKVPLQADYIAMRRRYTLIAQLTLTYEFESGIRKTNGKHQKIILDASSFLGIKPQTSHQK